MKNRKYKVCRENIYVGEVVKTRCVYRHGMTDISNKKSGRLDTGSWRSYRSILFTLNEDKLANDLLYNSPNYPVLNISDDERCMEFDRSITLIKDYCNLGELLEYFGYSEQLTYEDIINIRKTFFSGKFVYDNCELFGYRESNPEDWTYYKHGVKVTDPKKIKKCIRHYKKEQLFGHRTFSSIDENVLPRKYFNILEDRKDSTVIEFLSCEDVKLDAFAPHRHECNIKRLRR